MPYRADIQILRGIAVALVVLFHLGLVPMVHGFLGVDVFFVISGFLMAILCGQGTAREFFERRARRLLPAYFTTVIAVLGASMVMTVPTEHHQVIEQAVVASVFSSNIGFWMQNSYFSKIDFNPLLHLWSLGVEIQFYLMVPLLYIFGRRYKWLLPALFAASFILCLVMVQLSTKTAFFFMPFRIWQFMIGWLVAWHLSDGGRLSERRRSAYVGLAAFAAIGLIPLLPLDPDMPGVVLGHPALGSLGVCLATGCVIAFGLPKGLESSRVGRGLEVIGSYSYSIYLVHYPVIVLFLYTPFSGTVLDVKDTATLCTIVVLIALLSWILHNAVERRGAILYSAPRTVGLAVAIVVGAGLSAHINAANISDRERKIFSAWSDRSTWRCGKMFRALNPLSDVCELSPTGLRPERPRIMLVGDSHADAIKSPFVSVASKLGFRVFFVVTNNPLNDPRYDARWLLQQAVALKVTAVVLHFSSRNLKKSNPLGQLPQQLAAKNIRTALIMPVPDYDENVLEALYLHDKEGKSLPVLSRADYYARNRGVFSYAASQQGIEGFSYYDASPIFCHPQCLLDDAAGHPLYYDATHLTLTGARKLEGLFAELLTAIAAGRGREIHERASRTIGSG